MARKKAIPKRVAVIDFETDPFLFGRVPKPFACGVMFDKDSEKKFYIDFWGPDCVARVMDYLSMVKEPLIIYAHNGGKFDFHFFLKYLENPIKVIHGRIVKAKFGIHEFRDSWAIIPMALKGYAKKTIDYELFESDKREANKSEILEYLRFDCLYLFELVSAFNERFGPRLTIAGTAQRELRKFHPQTNQNESHDAVFREFYFGGRVQCFETGQLFGDFKIYDVNSMYPDAMKRYVHPIGKFYIKPVAMELDSEGWVKRFKNKMYFIEVEGYNRGALPVREKEGLSFEVAYGVFKTTSHELRMALKHGLFTVVKILDIKIPTQWQSFGEFVDTFNAEKVEAKRTGDKISETFAKLILNSAYGRFAIDPFSFHEYKIAVAGEQYQGFEPHECNDDYVIWRKKQYEKGDENIRGFEDVAIAASITSAARATLMEALHHAKRPVYCDTDSIICEGLEGVRMHDRELGAWKFEGSGTEVCIAAKKLYAVFNDGAEVKSASKGVKIDGDAIRRVALGEVILWQSDAPNFSATHETRFISRRAKKTALV